MFGFIIPVFLTFLQIIILVGIGFFLRRSERFSDDFFQSVSRFMISVAIPVYLFVRVAPSSTADLKASWIFLAAGPVIVLCGLLFGTIVFSVIRFGEKERRTATAMSAFGNTGYLPLSSVEFFPLSIPVVGEVFGIQTPFMFVAACLMPYTPILWSFGYLLITGKGGRPKLKDMINPPLVSICIAILFILTVPSDVLYNMKIPTGHIFRAMKQVGNLALPLVLISVGAMIGRLRPGSINLKQGMKMAGGVSIVRFLCMPGLFFLSYFLFLRRLNLSPSHYWVLFLVTNTPPALNLGVMANHAGVNREYTAFTIFFTYILYLVLFPIFASLFFTLPEFREAMQAAFQ